MTFRWHSIAALLLSASTAFAGWDGFPCPTNVSWYSLETNHYVSQLYSGLVERCDAIGSARPSVVDTYSNLFAGYTNTYTTITNGDIFVITNNFICYTNVTVTNQFLPFEYSWSQTNGTSGTATCYPSIKRSWFTTWDSKLFSICTSYVDTNQLGTDGTYNAWFSLPAQSNNIGASSPQITITGLFSKAAIGWTNRNVAHWTQSAYANSSDWLLASIHSGSNAVNQWTFKRWTDLTTAHPCNSLYTPIAEYIAAGTNAVTNLQMTVSGTAWGSLGSNVLTTSEVVSFSSTNDTVLTNSWRTITDITCSSVRANSNDAIRVTYKTLPSLYDSSVGWMLTPESLNERKACIDQLTVSSVSASSGFNSFGEISEGYGFDFQSPYGGGANGAMAQADASWPTSTLSYSYVNGSYSMRCRDAGWVVNRHYAQLTRTDWATSNTPPTNAFGYTAQTYAYSDLDRFAGWYYTDVTAGNDWSNNCIGLNIRFQQFTEVYKTTSETSGTYSSIVFTNTSLPGKPDWEAAVPAYGWVGKVFYSSRGYMMRGSPISIYRWDGTNGFKYK